MTAPAKTAQRSMRMRIPCCVSCRPCHGKAGCETSSSLRSQDDSGPLLATAVDLPAHQRDGFLIDACGIPGLDGGKVRLAGLVTRAGAPAMGFQKIRSR